MPRVRYYSLFTLLMLIAFESTVVTSRLVCPIRPPPQPSTFRVSHQVRKVDRVSQPAARVIELSCA